MAPNHLTELKRLCSANSMSTEEELLDTGGTMWLAGRPLAAEGDMLAIAQTEELHILMRERDILEVQREDEIFLVKVRAEANLIIRFQKVTKAIAPSCDCEEEAVPAVMRQQQGGTGPWGVPFGTCRLYVYCIYWGRYPICWWMINCPASVGKI